MSFINFLVALRGLEIFSSAIEKTVVGYFENFGGNVGVNEILKILWCNARERDWGQKYIWVLEFI